MNEQEQEAIDNYPPKGTPETAIIVSLDCEIYSVIWHTGRFFHAQCVHAGLLYEEIGLSDVPDEPGIWWFENGKPWHTTDWETGVPDDYGMDGDWRKATKEDFEKAGLEPLWD